jgi:Flp pilus assembly protein TadG
MGIIEFSVYGKNTLAIANATREGARAASIGKSTTEIRDRVKRFAAPLPVESPNGEVIIQVSNDKGVSYQTLTDVDGKNAAATDSLVRVRVNSANRTVTGAFGLLFNRQLIGSVTMRREGNVS